MMNLIRTGSGAAFFILFLSSCGGDIGIGPSTSDDVDELGQQLGDVMASIDEMGGTSTGTYSLTGAYYSHRLNDDPSRLDTLLGLFTIPSSEAVSCGVGSTYSTCTSNIITRTFNGCTYAGIVAQGTVTLSWGGGASNCLLLGANNTISRSPNFTLTGRRNATLSVRTSGSVGQRITEQGVAQTYLFTSDGIRRTFTSSSGAIQLDFSTMTTSSVTVTSSSRSGRKVTGGVIRTTNHLNGTTCNWTPTNLTWGNSCNCAISGSWSGSCSDGKTVSATISGCGDLRLTVGGDSSDIDLDRCIGV